MSRIVQNDIFRMKDERILLSSDGPDCNVLKLKPPMVFSKQNVDRFVSVLDNILKEVRTDSEFRVSEKAVSFNNVIKKSFLKSNPTITIKKSSKDSQIKSI